MVEEVGVTTWMGGQIRITDAEDTGKVISGSGAMIEVRLKGLVAIIDIAAGIGVHVGANGIYQTLSTPSTDRAIGAVSITTAK